MPVDPELLRDTIRVQREYARANRPPWWQYALVIAFLVAPMAFGLFVVLRPSLLDLGPALPVLLVGAGIVWLIDRARR